MRLKACESLTALFLRNKPFVETPAVDSRDDYTMIMDELLAIQVTD